MRISLEQLKKAKVSMPDLVHMIEWGLIHEALKKTGGNKTYAAEMLGINRTTLLERLRSRYGTCDLTQIDVARFDA